MDTTLAKLATLEGGVARLQDGLASVESGVNPREAPSNVVVKLLNAKPTTLTINGKGKLLCVGAGSIISGSGTNNITINIDGKQWLNLVRKDGNASFGWYSCQECLVSISEKNGVAVTAFGSVSGLSTLYEGTITYVDNKTKPPFNTDSYSPSCYVSYKPLSFSSTLKITTNMDSTTDKVLVAYSLEQ